MSFYSTGTATGPGAGDAFMLAQGTALTGGGWTAVDTISSTTGTRDVVYKGTALDATAGNAPYIRITQTSTTNITYRVYQDWDTTTHVGINETGNGTNTPAFTVQDASFTYFLRVNPVAMVVCAKIGVNYNKIYVGFLRRGLGLSRSGCTKSTGATSSGQPVINVASDMTSKLKVGQVVQIINYGHASGSANASKIEKKTILTIAAGSITFTANLTNAYDAGALVGENVLPVAVGGGGNGVQTGMTGTLFFPWDIDGTRTSNISHSLNPTEVVFNSTANNSPSTGWNEYSPGIYDLSTSTVGKTGFRGWYYHIEATTKGSQALEDIMTDGDNDFIILGIGTSITSSFGPRN